MANNNKVESTISGKGRRYFFSPLGDQLKTMRGVFIKAGYKEDDVDRILEKVSVLKTPGQLNAYIRIMKELLIPANKPGGVEWDLSRVNRANERIAMDKVANYLGDRDPTENEVQGAIKFLKSYISGGAITGAIGKSMLGAGRRE